MDTAAYLATQISQARQRKKLSRPELAGLADTTLPTVIAWEEGRGSRLVHLEAILRELGLELVVRELGR